MVARRRLGSARHAGEVRRASPRCGHCRAAADRQRGARMKDRKGNVRIFVSYAHRDPPLFRLLLESLLRWPGVDVQLWTDENIAAGTVPDQQIRAALDEMDIFVALITPFFDASSYIH